jgi:hypothetical protein
MNDDDKEIEIAVENALKQFPGLRATRTGKRYPIDRMNYAYDHWPMGQQGQTDAAEFLMNTMESSVGSRQWEQPPMLNRRKRKTKQNPNIKALDD